MKYNKLKKAAGILLGMIIFFVITEVGLRGVGWLLLKQRDRSFNQSENVYTILCLGESTTMLGGNDAYPRQLEHILQNRIPGKKIQVINKGLAGQNTDTILTKLPEYLVEYRPDLVLTMMGINDSTKFLKELKEKNFWLWQALRDFRVVRLAVLLKHEIFKQDIWSRDDDEEKNNDHPETAIAKATTLADASNQYQKAMVAASVYMAQKDYIKAENILRYLIESDECQTCNFQLWKDLVTVLYEQQNFAELVKEMPKSPYWGYEDLHFMELCQNPDYFEQALEAILEHTTYEPQVAFYYDAAANCYELAKDGENAHKLYEQAKSVRQKHLNHQTRNNYIKLHQMLKKAGIKGVYIQYPLLDVNNLKNLLFDEPDFNQMIFVKNKSIFEDLIKKDGYQAYFIDRFAGVFGHCTPEGNRVLAQNIADQIIKNNLIEQ